MYDLVHLEPLPNIPNVFPNYYDILFLGTIWRLRERTYKLEYFRIPNHGKSVGQSALADRYYILIGDESKKFDPIFEANLIDPAVYAKHVWEKGFDSVIFRKTTESIRLKEYLESLLLTTVKHSWWRRWFS